MGATRRYASHKPEPQELVHAGRKRWVDNHATPTSSRNRHICLRPWTQAPQLVQHDGFLSIVLADDQLRIL